MRFCTAIPGWEGVTLSETPVGLIVALTAGLPISFAITPMNPWSFWREFATRNGSTARTFSPRRSRMARPRKLPSWLRWRASRTIRSTPSFASIAAAGRVQ